MAMIAAPWELFYIKLKSKSYFIPEVSIQIDASSSVSDWLTLASIWLADAPSSKQQLENLPEFWNPKNWDLGNIQWNQRFL